MATVTIAGGDRDCSSAIIDAYQKAGLDVNASYTGNMRTAFLNTGKFEWWDVDNSSAQRGDIYLNESDHTAMCVDDGSGSYGYDALAEFSISETGGIDGAEGDQTGGESSIHGYYNYPWNLTLHCTDRELAERAAQIMEHLCTCPNHGYSQYSRWGDGTTETITIDGDYNGSYSAPTSSPAGINVRYRARVDGVWLDEMCNHTDTGGSGDDYAGDLGQPIEYLAVDMDGWYQVKTQQNGWLERVSGYNVGDLENGCAGDGSPIVAVRCYYETPNPDATGWLAIEYQVHTQNGEWLDCMRDLDDTGGSDDDFAGDDDKIVDGFRAQLVNV